jgi:hypothetical protein
MSRNEIFPKIKRQSKKMINDEVRSSRHKKALAAATSYKNFHLKMCRNIA